MTNAPETIWGWSVPIIGQAPAQRWVKGATYRSADLAPSAAAENLAAKIETALAYQSWEYVERALNTYCMAVARTGQTRASEPDALGHSAGTPVHG